MRGNHGGPEFLNSPTARRHRHQLASDPTREKCPAILATASTLLLKVKEPARAAASDRPGVDGRRAPGVRAPNGVIHPRSQALG
jgi:hypothetical protein